MDLSGLGELVVMEMRRTLMTAFVLDPGAFTIVHIYLMPVLYAVSNVCMLYALSIKTGVCVCAYVDKLVLGILTVHIIRICLDVLNRALL